MTDSRTGNGSHRAGAARHAVLLVAAMVSLALLGTLSGALDPLFERFAGGSSGPPPASQVSEALPDDASAGARRAPASSVTPPVATLERSDAIARNDRAVAAIYAGDLDLAIEILVEVVAEHPDVVAFADNLGEAYLRRARAQKDDPEAALEDFENALLWTRDDERRATIESLRDRARAIAETEKEFVVEPTLHFTFKFDGTRVELLDGVEDLKVLLESTYQEFGELFRRHPVEEGEPRIEVVLYRADGFDAVTGLGDWAGGVFDGTIRVPVADLLDSRRVARIRDVLRHETAHAFAHSIGGAEVPSWLNEGIAQWLENPARRHESVRFARARLAASEAPPFALSELTGNLTGWKERQAITRAYDQALAFTDFLVEQYGSDLVFEMIAACDGKGAAGAAEHFRSRLLVDLETVLGDFVDSLDD